MFATRKLFSFVIKLNMIHTLKCIGILSACLNAEKIFAECTLWSKKYVKWFET